MGRLMVLLLLLASAEALAGETKANSVEFSKTIEMKMESQTNHCAATASVDYFQRGPEAQLEATIDNHDCAASSGKFVVEVTIRTDGAEASEKLKFPETWSREDDASVVVNRRYPIGDDTDLLRVKVRNMRCTCTEATEPASNP
jgi:hypothetical protein